MSELWDRLPLPAEHFVPMLAGLALQLRFPRRIPPEVAFVGWPCIAAGAALNVWAVVARGGGNLEHPDKLVVTGPYAFTRNPMYVGWSLLHAGVGLATRSPWVLVSWLVPFALLPRGVLAEERMLDAMFGTEFADYRRRVPRYLPIGTRT